MIPEYLHHLDPIPNTMGRYTLHKPITFSLQNDFFVFDTLLVSVRFPCLTSAVLDCFGFINRKFERFLPVSHHASKNCTSVLLIKSINELRSLYAIGFFAGKLSCPHTGKLNINPYKLWQQRFMFVAIYIQKQAVHIFA